MKTLKEPGGLLLASIESADRIYSSFTDDYQPMKKTISVIITDDHHIFRNAAKTILESHPQIKVVAVCESGEEAVELSKKLQPDIVLMDINMEKLDGFEATALLRKELPGIKVVGFSVHNEPLYVSKMLQAGAMGYLTKTSPRSEIIEAILQVHSGQQYICKEIKENS